MSRSRHAPAFRADAGTVAGRAGSSPFAASRVRQRKLAVGSVNDPLEDEADRFADRVVAVSPSSSSEPNAAPAEIQRFATSPGGAAAAPPSVEATLAGGGSPLPAALRNQMEGAIIMGLGPALREEIRLEDGTVANLFL